MNNNTALRPKGFFSSIRSKMLFTFILLFILAITLIELTNIYGIPFTAFTGEYRAEQTRAFESLNLVADLKKERLSRWLEERKDDASVIAKSMLIKTHLEELKMVIQEKNMSGDDGRAIWTVVKKSEAFRVLHNHLDIVKKMYGVYDEIEIIDPKSRVIIVSSRKMSVGSTVKDHINLLKVSLINDYTIDIDFDPIDGNLDLDMYRIIKDKSKIIAILLMRVNTRDFIQPMLHTGGGLGETGEVLLVDHDVKILTPLKHLLPDGTRPLPLEFQIEAKPATYAARGEEGIIDAVDYRGIQVLASYRHIRITPELGWGMVVKKDRAEVFTYLQKRLKYFYLTSSAGIIIFGIIIIIVIRNVTRPILRLSNATVEVGKGNLDTMIEIKSKDEVGQLARDFDEMRLKLKESYSGLEDKVREKTGELFSTIEKLQELNVDLHDTQSAMLNLVEDLEDSKSKLEIEIEERKKAEKELRKHRDHLEDMVQERTKELEISKRSLEEAVKEIETFSYSISHDLKAPLRAISGYSGMLHQDYSGSLDEEGNRLLNVISENSVQMGQLIEDILMYSKMVRMPLERREIHIKKLAEGVILELKGEYKDRDIKFNVEEMPNCKGDSVMIKQVLMNLISNAIKFTRNEGKAEIELGSKQVDNETIYYVKDNGVGFDMKYAEKAFGLFQRLHSTKEFEGTGVGLAIIQRLIRKHGGKMWADAKVNEGASFFFALGS